MFVTTRAEAPFNFSTTSGVTAIGAALACAVLGAGTAGAFISAGVVVAAGTDAVAAGIEAAGAGVSGWDAAGAGALKRGCNNAFAAAATGENSLGE